MSPFASSTVFYRISAWDQKAWPDDVVSGTGAFYRTGRFHRPHQRTVYASNNPVVALTEGAHYAAIDRQEWLGSDASLCVRTLKKPSTSTVQYEMECKRLLWAFTLDFDPFPRIFDLLDPNTFNTLPVPLNVLLNPCGEYENCQKAADEIRAMSLSMGTQPYRSYLGLEAPSARTPPAGNPPSYHRQQILFVTPSFSDRTLSINKQEVLKARIVGRWQVVYAFADRHKTANRVDMTTLEVDWRNPLCRISSDPTKTYASPHLPSALPLNKWLKIAINYP